MHYLFRVIWAVRDSGENREGGNTLRGHITACQNGTYDVLSVVSRKVRFGSQEEGEEPGADLPEYAGRSGCDILTGSQRVFRHRHAKGR